MVNSRGVLRVVEATIASLIVLGALLLLVSNRPPPNQTPPSVERWLPSILEEIAFNDSLRNEIVNDYSLNTSLSTAEQQRNSEILLDIDQFIGTRITNRAYNRTTLICPMEALCALPAYPIDAIGDVFSAERIISSTPDSPYYAPKKVKIFAWRIV